MYFLIDIQSNILKIYSEIFENEKSLLKEGGLQVNFILSELREKASLKKDETLASMHLRNQSLRLKEALLFDDSILQIKSKLEDLFYLKYQYYRYLNQDYLKT